MSPLPADPRAVEAAHWAARLADGPLTAQETSALDAWLDADPANAETMEEIVRGWRAVEDYAGAPELLALRNQALQSARRAHGRRTGAHRPRWSALAAALALVAVAGWGWTWLTPHAYATGVGERRVVALADGSKISLDSDTRVRVRYALGRRSLWLDRGRAKFEVARDPVHPFSVRSHGEEVVATGTAFSVEAIGGEVHVVLYEGHVAVLSGAGKSRRLEADQALTPGHELVAEAAPGRPPQVMVAAVDPVRSLAWESGQLVFEDEPLTTAVARMNRSATTPLALGDAAVGAIRISGVFRAGDTDRFVQGLVAAFPVRAQATGNQVVLSEDPARAARNG